IFSVKPACSSVSEGKENLYKPYSSRTVRAAAIIFFIFSPRLFVKITLPEESACRHSRSVPNYKSFCSHVQKYARSHRHSPQVPRVRAYGPPGDGSHTCFHASFHPHYLPASESDCHCRHRRSQSNLPAQTPARWRSSRCRLPFYPPAPDRSASALSLTAP